MVGRSYRSGKTQVLVSLPVNAVADFAELERKPLPEWVPASDPAGAHVGSGGGTTNLLVEAWRKTGAAVSFPQWLHASTKLLIHSGGQSRRLPSYAAAGKILLPIPVFRWAQGQRLDQTLLDLQLPLYRRILDHAPATTVAMVTCGDVLLRSMGTLPLLPEVDVLCFGLWVEPEAATRHGVFFRGRDASNQLSFFLQKPSVDRVHQLASDHYFLVDTGIWLLSERAIRVLMEQSGWQWDDQRFVAGRPEHYELYAHFGLALGHSPTVADDRINALSAAVVPLPGGEFYHFGTSRELVHSCLRLQNLVQDQRELGTLMIKPHPEMFVQNSALGVRLRPENQTIWVENASLAERWSLASEHVLTGIPVNDWALRLPRGACLDMVPIGEDEFSPRVYGIDDSFQGAIGDSGTVWCGEPAMSWFARRDLSLQDAGIAPDADIQHAELFPLLTADAMDESFIQWLLTADTEQGSTACARRWCDAPRLSASALSQRANLRRLYEQRHGFLSDALQALARNASRSVFYNLDLSHTARLFASSGHPLPPTLGDESSLMRRVHHHMFTATVQRSRREEGWEREENSAFQLLREAIMEDTRGKPARPTRRLLDDQIIWGRCPVRLDLAGGWTDTPPYCLNEGGKVVNLAADLNGQPPIQIFAKISEQAHIVLRSIDLGVEERITTYEELRNQAAVGSGFSIARAALALAGFLPEFAGAPAAATLKQQLREFGGGIEISLLAAVPKGSGLGTSSILAATLLGTLSDLCGLGWDHREICTRTLTLEQMLTTGGGWQDQIGGITRGLKLADTQPGLVQNVVVRWLPDHLFTDPAFKSCMLLYYTGITRLAKNILKEIVRGMFLNNRRHMAILTELRNHAMSTYEVLMRGPWDGLCDCIRTSWELNQRLDEGTNPPQVQDILAQIGDYLAAAKLLGAGGGGYLFMLAKDPESAARIRAHLEKSPPNSKARFVGFTVSDTGLEITRS